MLYTYCSILRTCLVEYQGFYTYVNATVTKPNIGDWVDSPLYLPVYLEENVTFKPYGFVRYPATSCRCSDATRTLAFCTNETGFVYLPDLTYTYSSICLDSLKASPIVCDFRNCLIRLYYDFFERDIAYPLVKGDVSTWPVPPTNIASPYLNIWL